jgi:hypothetical protein
MSVAGGTAYGYRGGLESFRLGGVSKAASRRNFEEERRSNPVIISVFRIASLRSQ